MATETTTQASTEAAVWESQFHSLVAAVEKVTAHLAHLDSVGASAEVNQLRRFMYAAGLGGMRECAGAYGCLSADEADVHVAGCPFASEATDAKDSEPLVPMNEHVDVVLAQGWELVAEQMEAEAALRELELARADVKRLTAENAELRRAVQLAEEAQSEAEINAAKVGA